MIRNVYLICKKNINFHMFTHPSLKIPYVLQLGSEEFK
jgi:hypothetical protein